MGPGGLTSGGPALSWGFGPGDGVLPRGFPLTCRTTEGGEDESNGIEALTMMDAQGLVIHLDARDRRQFALGPQDSLALEIRPS